MSGYIGATPVPQATQHRESFTCTVGQTSFASAGYTPQFLDVFLNGNHLSPADFVATNGSDVVLVSGAAADDVCDIISHSAFELNAQTFTGVTSFADGSAGAPSITNTGDVNTGIFFPAADTIAFAEGGAEAMRIDSSGHVGIGTSSPNIANFGKAFTINDPASSNQIPAIELAYGSNTRGANIAVDNRASSKVLAITAVASDLSMTFGTNNTERMRIDTTGAVTMPLQPAFLVQPANNNQTNVAGTGATIIFGTERFDQGSDFASNTFTAPVTGRYQFNVSVFLIGVDADVNYYTIKLVTSNRNYFYDFDPDFGQDPARWTVSFAALADMDASDTATVVLSFSPDDATSTVDVADATFFSGFLVC